MSRDDSRRPIVIKRKKRPAKHGSHGAWKIAYADFMTAMMAFFLVMWLLGGLSDAQLENVSEYFRTPLAAAMIGGDRQGASTSVIPGGGDDPLHTDGQQALTSLRATNYTPDRGRLRALKQRLESQIENNPELEKLSSQLRIEIVQDGLRIQILDDRRRPMFEIGSTRLADYVQRLLATLAPTLNAMENKLTLTGHTDDLRYAGSGDSYSNWELSADRANAARRALVASGLDSGKLLRVVGAAATQRVSNNGPRAAENRRISILVLNDRAQRHIEHPSGPADDDPAENHAEDAAPQPAGDNISAKNEEPTGESGPSEETTASSVSLVEPRIAAAAFRTSLRDKPE